MNIVNSNERAANIITQVFSILGDHPHIYLCRYSHNLSCLSPYSDPRSSTRFTPGYLVEEALLIQLNFDGSVERPFRSIQMWKLTRAARIRSNVVGSFNLPTSVHTTRLHSFLRVRVD